MYFDEHSEAGEYVPDSVTVKVEVEPWESEEDMDVVGSTTSTTRRKRGPRLTEEERKRNRQEQKRKANLHRISIGREYKRWMQLKSEQNLNTNADVAKLLLDHFMFGSQTAEASTSNPVSTMLNLHSCTQTPPGSGRLVKPTVSASTVSGDKGPWNFNLSKVKKEIQD